jgi:hypothetical protein
MAGWEIPKIGSPFSCAAMIGFIRSEDWDEADSAVATWTTTAQASAVMQRIRASRNDGRDRRETTGTERPLYV